MNKALEYAGLLTEEYAELLKEKQFTSHIRNQKGEGYESSYAGGKFQLKAVTPMCHAFATRELMLGSKSGHFADFLGEKKPCYALRPLWFSMPPSLINVHTLCQRTLELGYNAWFIEDPALFSIVREYGIKIISSYDNGDYLFWESKQNRLEAALKELKEQESKNKPLILYLSAANEENARAQAEWMSYLCDEMGPHSILAFPDSVGILHPFWHKLRKSQDCSHTPLLPVVNIGSVGLGEGLWPALTLDLSQEFYERAVRHPFAGMIARVSQLPKREGLLDCSLWVAAQVLWNRTPPQRAADTWFLANRPDMSYCDHRTHFETIRSLALQAARLRHLTLNKQRDQLRPEESRATLESISGQLKELHYKLESEEFQRTKHTILPSLFDYYQFFERDVYRYLIHYLNHFNPPLASLLANEGGLESFWSKGGKAGAPVTFLDKPHVGSGVMERIFSENRL